MRVIVLIAAIARLGAAQAPQTAVKLASGITKPTLLSKEEPTYTPEAQRAGLIGTVNLGCTVDTNGVCGWFRIDKGLGLGLDEQAIEAVKRWRFSPGLKDGVPIPVFTAIAVRFRLLDKEKQHYWHLTRAMFDTPPGAERPHLVSSGLPERAPPSHITIALSFEINEHGEVAGVAIDKPVDADQEQLVDRALKMWRFKPAMKDGHPVATRANFEFDGEPGN